jgi:hypothetical protein
MAYAQEVKEIAYMLDSECWKSYSGCSRPHKWAMELRRVAALKFAQELVDELPTIATPRTLGKRMEQAGFSTGRNFWLTDMVIVQLNDMKGTTPMTRLNRGTKAHELIEELRQDRQKECRGLAKDILRQVEDVTDARTRWIKARQEQLEEIAQLQKGALKAYDEGDLDELKNIHAQLRRYQEDKGCSVRVHPVFMSADLSGLEARVIARIMEDSPMSNAFRKGRRPYERA